MKDRLKTLAGVLRAFGDQKRLMIVKMLASTDGETLCVSDIAERLKVTQPAASQHIRVLKSIGVLTENRRGFRVYYSIDADILREYKAAVDDLFRKAFEKCAYDYVCRECPYNNSCGDIKEETK